MKTTRIERFAGWCLYTKAGRRFCLVGSTIILPVSFVWLAFLEGVPEAVECTREFFGTWGKEWTR